MGSHDILHTTRLLVLVAVVAKHASAAAVQDKGDIDICRVRMDSGSDGSHKSLRVLALPGNRRAVTFSGESMETQVICVSQGTSSSEVLPPGCTAWPEEREPASNVSECPSCPCTPETNEDMVSASNKMIFEVGIQPACQKAVAGAPVDVLLFGMGGGELHVHTMARCPQHTRVESVEADARMAAIATKFFGVSQRDGVSVIDVEDATSAAAALSERQQSAYLVNAAGTSLQEQPPARGRLQVKSKKARGRLNMMRSERNRVAALGKRKWDVVAIDCFIGKGVTPDACRSREFLTYLRILVRSGGTVVHHMWHTSPYDDSVAPTFNNTVELHKNIFGQTAVSVRPVTRDKSVAFDSVIIVKAEA